MPQNETNHFEILLVVRNIKKRLHIKKCGW